MSRKDLIKLSIISLLTVAESIVTMLIINAYYSQEEFITSTFITRLFIVSIVVSKYIMSATFYDKKEDLSGMPLVIVANLIFTIIIFLLTKEPVLLLIPLTSSGLMFRDYIIEKQSKQSNYNLMLLFSVIRVIVVVTSTWLLAAANSNVLAVARIPFLVQGLIFIAIGLVSYRKELFSMLTWTDTTITSFKLNTIKSAKDLLISVSYTIAELLIFKKSNSDIVVSYIILTRIFNFVGYLNNMLSNRIKHIIVADRKGNKENNILRYTSITVAFYLVCVIAYLSTFGWHWPTMIIAILNSIIQIIQVRVRKVEDKLLALGDTSTPLKSACIEVLSIISINAYNGSTLIYMATHAAACLTRLIYIKRKEVALES